MKTGVVKPESLAKAIRTRLPERNLATALEALDGGLKLASSPSQREGAEGSEALLQ